MVVALSVIMLALIGLVGYLAHRLERAVVDGGARYIELVQRVENNPSLVIHEVEPTPPPLSDRPYISEFQHDDKAWNDFIGAEPDEDDGE